jgi:hypothetical protein
MPFNSDDSDDNTPALTFTLPLYLINVFFFTFIAFIISKVIKKEHITSTRIRAIYILNKKQS